MQNPWYAIPLSDYERHMSLPTVGQAALIADEFARLLECHRPASACVLGCAGGNGLERAAGSEVSRLVALDINPAYAEATLARYRNRVAGLQVVVADVQSEGLAFPPVGFLFAALLFEYVDVQKALQFASRHCEAGGVLAVLLQLAHSAIAEVTPSPFTSLEKLNPIMRLVAPTELRERAAAAGFRHLQTRTLRASGGKSFSLEQFQILQDR